jgi:Mrp family chromosome partitioning ATPase
MTALDQAFIKAYVQHGGVPAPAMVEKAHPVSLSDVLVDRRPSAAVAPEVRRLAVVKVLESMPAKTVVGLPDARAVEAFTRPSRRADVRIEVPASDLCDKAPAVPSVPSAGRPPDAPRAERHVSVAELGIPKSVCCFAPPPPTIPIAFRSPGAETVPTVLPENRRPSTPQPPERAIPSPPAAPSAAKEGATSVPSAGESMRPAFQTDSFAWPEVCRLLGSTALEAVDRVADALRSGISEGRKMIGLASNRRGEGCTTLLLCVARRLSQRGLSVVMVDADLAQPDLAARLDLVPEADWQDVAAGRLPLTEVLIESVEDRLVLLPLNRPAADRGRPAGFRLGDLAGLPALRKHYDLVLADLGPLGDAARTDELAAAAAVGAIDALVLVHNVGLTPREELSRLSDRLASAGAVQVGIAQNFVPRQEPVGA